LTKLCDKIGIKIVMINPVYSSLIGNLKYDCIDEVNASIEISRRGIFQFVKGKFYPKLSVKDQWKEYLTNVSEWKELAGLINKSGLRYRVLEVNSFEMWKAGLRNRYRFY
jgi:hypothetical protein